MLKTITVTLGNTKYMLYGTPTTPSIPVIDALQILARIPKIYSTKSKNGYFKFVSSSEFKSDSNALIFSLIEHELSELCEFYKLYPKMVNFHAAPSVLQMAVIMYKWLSLLFIYFRM